jgi:hypothetical protein
MLKAPSRPYNRRVSALRRPIELARAAREQRVVAAAIKRPRRLFPRTDIEAHRSLP